ncbi:MAG TPA: dihydrofolate reductase family protein [Acidimicrobiales bacterium]|nr:dihydrofolate reductase family protein [Acidimicrobiales bacterium]
MHKIIVIAFTSLDGIIEDPDGSRGTANGGWAFRHGPEAVAGDKFALGPVLESAALLLGRRTWELFSHLWPNRSDEFSSTMNRIPKLVVSRTLTDVSTWANSTVVGDDLLPAVEEQTRRRDIVVAGSVSIVHALAAADLVDEYRLLVFPTALGEGARLFAAETAPTHLRLLSADAAGQAVLLRYGRPAG